jgi:hypothetical protein
VVGVDDGAIVERAGLWVSEDVGIETEEHVGDLKMQAQVEKYGGRFAALVAVANVGEDVSVRRTERRDAAV